MTSVVVVVVMTSVGSVVVVMTSVGPWFVDRVQAWVVGRDRRGRGPALVVRVWPIRSSEIDRLSVGVDHLDMMEATSRAPCPLRICAVSSLIASLRSYAFAHGRRLPARPRRRSRSYLAVDVVVGDVEAFSGRYPHAKARSTLTAWTDCGRNEVDELSDVLTGCLQATGRWRCLGLWNCRGNVLDSLLQIAR